MSETIRFWEEVNANIWPAFDYMHFDGWILRLTAGYSTNSNSVWPLYIGERPLDEKITFCEQLYADRGLACCFRLAPLPGHDELERLLLARGYEQSNPNLVMIQNALAAPAQSISELSLEEWLEAIFLIQPTDDLEIIEWEKRLHRQISLPGRYVIVERDGKPCGYGRSLQQGNILNLEKLWVQPQYRNCGAGTALIQGLLHMGQKTGADTAFLTVNEDNAAAQRLYARLGFEQRYAYRYLVPQAAA
ncbi:MAG: GNAT family N-acetyltransferase [Ardenticatenales bacterium]|nr:GNAT family N-acetyltransferase [Ardenticatenales bacterium]